jgi:hypothetical protein
LLRWLEPTLFVENPYEIGPFIPPQPMDYAKNIHMQ